MAAFDHVILLLSFVFALALTHLLSRVGGLMLARKRVRFSALHAFMVVNAVVLVLVNWLALWFVHTTSAWDLFSIVIFFLFALCSYFFCAAAAPEVPFEGAIDLEAFYWENYKLFYGLIALQTIVAMLTSLSAPLRRDWSLFVWTNIDSLPFFIPPILATTIRSRWAQWASAIVFLAMQIWWLITFNSQLK
jgi:hypothetical protein